MSYLPTDILLSPQDEVSPYHLQSPVLKSLRCPQLHCSGMLGEDQLTAECDPSEGTYH